jgi:hypothetical protein
MGKHNDLRALGHGGEWTQLGEMPLFVACREEVREV